MSVRNPNVHQKVLTRMLTKKQSTFGRHLSQYRGTIAAVGKTFSLYTSVHSRQLVDVEEEFLHAAEFGDIPTVRRLLQENTELNVDCIDALGRTALRLAVKNEHLEVRFLTLFAPIATKVVCFSRLLKCLKSLYGKQCGPRSDCVCSGPTLFASILNLSVMLGNYLQQTTSSNDIFSCIFP